MDSNDSRLDEIITRKVAEASAEGVRQMDELEWLQYQRAETARQLKQSQKRIKKACETLTPFGKAHTSPIGRAFHFMDRSVTILRGLRMGLRIGDAIRLALNIHHIFKKRK